MQASSVTSLFGAQSNPTFSKDVAAILYENCTFCHRPGEVAPFSLISYQDAAKRASLIAAVTASHYMPPWKPDIGLLRFRNERRLTEEQIATLREWAKDGAPRGDLEGAPAPPRFPEGWLAGTPDMIVSMGGKFQVPADGPDLVACFVVPFDSKTDRYVQTVEFRPNARSVVHHALFYVDTTGGARKMDEATPEPGYPCFGGPLFVPAASLGGWGPGLVPMPSPPETAQKISKGSDLVMQIHYHPSGSAQDDLSTMGLTFTGAPKHERVNLILASRQIDIPAGDARYEVNASSVVPTDLDAIAVAPHAHYLCQEMTIEGALPDGTRLSLLHIRDWDFNWQGVFQFERPVRLPKGTVLRMRYVYDNSQGNVQNPSSPPKRVKYGNSTTDEMAVLRVSAMLVNESDSPEFHKAVTLDVLNQMLTFGDYTFAPNPTRLKTLARLFGADAEGRLDAKERSRLLQFAGVWLTVSGAIWWPFARISAIVLLLSACAYALLRLKRRSSSRSVSHP